MSRSAHQMACRNPKTSTRTPRSRCWQHTLSPAPFVCAVSVSSQEVGARPLCGSRSSDRSIIGHGEDRPKQGIPQVIEKMRARGSCAPTARTPAAWSAFSTCRHRSWWEKWGGGRRLFVRGCRRATISSDDTSVQGVDFRVRWSSSENVQGRHYS